eukprot:jgi/Psemu1/302206/fgenesh1_kg.61_\
MNESAWVCSFVVVESNEIESNQLQKRMVPTPKAKQSVQPRKYWTSSPSIDLELGTTYTSSSSALGPFVLLDTYTPMHTCTQIHTYTVTGYSRGVPSRNNTTSMDGKRQP